MRRRAEARIIHHLRVVDGDERRDRELEPVCRSDSERAVTEISRRVRVHAKDDGRQRDGRRRSSAPAGLCSYGVTFAATRVHLLMHRICARALR